MADKEYLTYSQIQQDCKDLAKLIFQSDFQPEVIVAVTRGGMLPACLLAQFLNIKEIHSLALASYTENNERGDMNLLVSPLLDIEKKTLFVDDLYDSGATYNWIKAHYNCENFKVAEIYTKNKEVKLDFPAKNIDPNTWIVFPWEHESFQSELEQEKTEKKLIADNFNFDTELKKTAYLFKSGMEELITEEAKEEFIKAIEEKQNAPKEEVKIQLEDISEVKLDAGSRVIKKGDNSYIDEDKEFIGIEGFPLSKEQKQAINWLERKRGNLTLLTGKAGAGKSTVIKNLMHRNDDWSICSTTGKSAILIGGCTVDKFFCYDRDKNAVRNEYNLSANMRSCGKVIIIDEASMAGKKMFETCYGICLRYNKDLILVGDWGQASPVKDDWIFESNTFLEDVQVLKLKECHRQNDMDFLETLDKVRNGEIDEKVNQMLCSRITPTIPEDDSCVVIYATNAAVKAYNEEKVKALAEKSKQEIFTLTSNIKVINSNVSEAVKKQALENSMFANEELLCVGCKVLITRNDQSQDREYVNGDTGILINKKKGSYSILLDRTGHSVTLNKTSHEIKNAADEVEIVITGYPIKAGYAMTCHKVQGMTIPQIYVDMDSISRMYSHGLCYVAISRVRKLEDLHLSSWNPNAVVCDSITKNFL